MVIYCMGDILEKRHFFRMKTESGEVSVDNEDVLHTFSLGGTSYCVIGSNPFSDMTVKDYVAYCRSLMNNIPIRGRYTKRLLKICGMKTGHNRKVGQLDRVSLRSALLASKIEPNTKNLYINFDGLNYSRKNNGRMKKLVAKLAKRYDVFLAISDMRFVPFKANVQIFKNNTIQNETSTNDKTWYAIRSRAETRTPQLFTIKGITECR